MEENRDLIRVYLPVKVRNFVFQEANFYMHNVYDKLKGGMAFSFGGEQEDRYFPKLWLS